MNRPVVSLVAPLVTEGLGSLPRAFVLGMIGTFET